MFFFFFNELLIWLIKWHLISIGLFWEDSVSLQFSCSASISTPLPFFVDSCCHSCESLLQLLWACMSVLVTKWSESSQMTKTYKTFCNELFKRLLAFQCWVRVCFGWVCQVCACVGAHLSACVCIQYVFSLHLTIFESGVGRREKAHWTGPQ